MPKVTKYVRRALAIFVSPLVFFPIAAALGIGIRLGYGLWWVSFTLLRPLAVIIDRVLNE